MTTMDYSIEQLDWLAQKLYTAGAFAKEVTSVDMAFAVLLAGQEMGFSPMAAIRSIQIVKGKLGLTADAQVAVCVRRRDVCSYFRLDESTDERATYTTHRAGAPSAVTFSYTMAQAKTAKLTNSGTWQSHPAAMLRARASSALARSTYPDLVGGIYEPDEMREILAENTTTTTARVVQSLPAPQPQADAEPAPFVAYRARVAATASVDALVATCLELAPTVAAHRDLAWAAARGRAIDLGETEESFTEALKAAKAITREPSAWATVAAVTAGLDAAQNIEALKAVTQQHGAAVAKLPEALRAALNDRRKARRAAFAAEPVPAAVMLEKLLRAAKTIPDVERVGEDISAAFESGAINADELTALAAVQDKVASDLEREVAA